MKGYRFYEEYNTPQDKREDSPNGRVFAAITEQRNPKYNGAGILPGWLQDGYGSPRLRPDLIVYCSVDVDWLRESCKQVSEAEARKICPILFAKIEESERK